MSTDFRGISSQPVLPSVAVFHGSIDNSIKTICVTIGSLIGMVQAFDNLFKRPVFFRDRIVVGKSGDLSDFKSKILSKLVKFGHGH